MRGENSTIEVEYLHPFLKDNSYLSSADIVTLSSRIRAGSAAALVFELPWVSGALSVDESLASFFGQSTRESQIGNPYLGLEMGSMSSIFFGEVGVRIPLMSEHAAASAIAGINGDFDRFEAYSPQIFQIGGALNLKPALGAGFHCRLRLGPSFDFSTRSGGGSETLINYGVLLSYESEKVDAGAGVVGRASTTSSSNQSVEQLEGSLRFHIDHVHPAVQLRAPLDVDLQTVFDLELGLNLAFDF
jgi:hypothetical protein